MNDELADMWKSEGLINHQVIDNLSPDTIARLSEILNKLKQEVPFGASPVGCGPPTKTLRKLCENPQQKYGVST